MTSEGPMPYSGNILDSPDILWMEDHWTAEEEEEASRAVAAQGFGLPGAWRDKYEREARKNWDLFYVRNSTNFFKDRHYLGRVFPELAETDADRELSKVLEVKGEGCSGRRSGRRTLLELGCGVGNAVFPLLEKNRGLYIVAVDLSSKGIALLKRHPMYGCGRCEAMVLDATVDDLPAAVLEGGGVDLVLLQFSMSAVAPKDMRRVALLAERALRPGGKLLLRDYGRHDEAQLRFSKGRRLGDNIYVRQDGTMSYFFSLDDVRRLFCGRSGPSSSSGREAHHDHHDNNLFPGGGMGASLVEEELWFVRRQYANRGQKVARRRVWVHGKFRKPLRLGEARGPESLPIPPK
ncbi:unnamed protein product [Ascophyllum nodosum]